MPEWAEVKSRAAALVVSVAAVWAVSLWGLFVDPGVAYDMALVPRRLDGLPGIVGMPFVHGSMSHLLANTLPMLVLGGMIVLRGAGYYLLVALAIALVGGLALWTIGREVAHIGASGVVFGFFGFLVTRGLYERRLQSMTIALVVLLFYGGMIWGVLPQDDGISWDGHLCGLVAGCVAARGAFALDRRAGEEARQA